MFWNKVSQEFGLKTCQNRSTVCSTCIVRSGTSSLIFPDPSLNFLQIFKNIFSLYAAYVLFLPHTLSLHCMQGAVAKIYPHAGISQHNFAQILAFYTYFLMAWVRILSRGKAMFSTDTYFPPTSNYIGVKHWFQVKMWCCRDWGFGFQLGGRRRIEWDHSVSVQMHCTHETAWLITGIISHCRL
jgi:hypothetical protein